MDLSVTVLGLQTFLIGSLSRTGDNYSLNLEAKLCISLFMTCLPTIEVLSEVNFPAFRPKGTTHLFLKDNNVFCTVTGSSL